MRASRPHQASSHHRDLHNYKITPTLTSPCRTRAVHRVHHCWPRPHDSNFSIYMKDERFSGTPHHANDVSRGDE